ncbi:MAG: hypothetical protein NVS3B10_22500 [Polyangiales bacterium]
MPTDYEVQQGDCLSSIAEQHGFRDWRTIYDDAANADFRKLRPDPNVISPGDWLVIPDPKPSKKSVSISLEQSHKFKVSLPKTFLRIAVHDEDDKPLSGKKYELRLGDVVRKGSTDGEGIVEQRVGPTATAATLTVWADREGDGAYFHWQVKIGHLDPVDTVAGVQARLNNLGYGCGDVDGVAGARTIAALRAFQDDAGVKVTGEPDDDTKKALVDAHGKT